MTGDIFGFLSRENPPLREKYRQERTEPGS
jgi:hypothetical protein